MHHMRHTAAVTVQRRLGALVRVGGGASPRVWVVGPAVTIRGVSTVSRCDLAEVAVFSASGMVRPLMLLLVGVGVIIALRRRRVVRVRAAAVCSGRRRRGRAMTWRQLRLPPSRVARALELLAGKCIQRIGVCLCCVSLLCVSAVCLCVSLLCVAVCLRRPSSGSPAVVHCPVPLLLRLPLPLLSLLRVPVRIVLWLRCERLSLPYPGRRLLLRWGIVRREVLRVAAATAAVRSHHFACSARGLFRSVWESEWQGRKVLVRRTGIVLSSAASDAPTALCHVPGGPLSN